MRKLTLLAINCLLLLSQLPHVFADSENVSKEIERIEIGENCETIYYKDGHKEVFVTSRVNVNFGASTGTAHVIEIPQPPPHKPFPIDKIFRIIRHILEIFSSCGVGGSLIAWMIWNIIKRLRRGRPRDYHEVDWQIARIMRKN